MFVTILYHTTLYPITCILENSGAPVSAVAYTWLPASVIRPGYECTRKQRMTALGCRSGAGERNFVGSNVPTWTGQKA